jgi:putative Holliday junction resolvase
MKALSIDFGTRKSGVAVSDDSGSIAVPYGIFETKNLLKEIELLLKNKKFEVIVIGESVNSQGEHNQVFASVTKFVEKLQKEFELELHGGLLSIVYEKEFMTSKHARSVDEGKNKLGKHIAVDDRAAALTLQRHLDKENIKNGKKVDEDFEGIIHDNEDF